LDRHDREKQDKAKRLIADAAKDHALFISTQVLQEFFVTATRKLAVEPLKAKAAMKAFTGLTILKVSEKLIYDAIDVQILNTLSFWDALIVATAAEAGCQMLFTEDLNDGQIISGVRIVRPF
jgi:predicted nucleic acid-binding protein